MTASTTTSTFVLIHGAADVGWSCYLVAEELRAHGHEVITPDLPCDDESAGLPEFADAVEKAVGASTGDVLARDVSPGARRDLVVVGHSFGGFTAPLIADRLPVTELIYVAAMIPSPGERPAGWWAHTGYEAAVAEQAALDGGLTGNEDPYVSFLGGVPEELAQEAMRRSRGQADASSAAPWPLAAHPQVPTRALVARDDRFFPADFLRRVTRERLGIEAEEIPGCHCAMLSHPRQLAAALELSLR
ncbi:alpha/beta fold hydrolase [Brachybacterium tyrofermentans]|uniref:alpha/beta fold hydrolase n=1 Tax=Brachybacterium tyrofermentans TaxID=47848 RepID=UPI003FB77EA1